MTEVFIIHFSTTLFMTGLVWMVQIVHYPLFKNVGSEQFLHYEKQHSKLITYIVAPVMSFELVSGIILVINDYSLRTTLSFISYFIRFLGSNMAVHYFYSDTSTQKNWVPDMMRELLII